MQGSATEREREGPCIRMRPVLGAEEICKVLAVCVGQGEPCMDRRAEQCLSQAEARPSQSVRGMRLASERAERGRWPTSQ